MRVDKMAGMFPARRWCAWRWQECFNPDGTLCLRRLTLFRCPWFSAMVHWMYEAEPAGWRHSHGWSFVSLILRGWYVEMRDDGARRRARYNRVRPGEFHRVHSVSKETCVSLVLAGPWKHAVERRCN